MSAERTLDSIREGREVHSLLERFCQIRHRSRSLIEHLEPEDCVIQSMPDVSPARWHLAHTTWFFETFVLARQVRGYTPFHPAFEYLFNSYYNQVGRQFPRPRRGLLSRPTVREVLEYRQHVDDQVERFLSGDLADEQALRVIETGLNHEEQHQELMLTDLKHVFSCNPLYPVYRERPESTPTGSSPPLAWIPHPEGLQWIGHDGQGFAFDNEGPRHRHFLESFDLATRLSTNAEFIDFVADGGYRRPELWLSAGWQWVNEEGIQAPLYWENRDGQWWNFTLAGLQPVDPAEPVCHVSYFEADAFARWAGGRLPTEAEWEIAAHGIPVDGNLFENHRFHPAPRPDGRTAPSQLFGDVWEWTQSPYTAYPGFAPVEGALGEYNGKFMCQQFVLRGGSCVTPRNHIRRTYRNFFPPDARWQFSGIRLARS